MNKDKTDELAALKGKSAGAFTNIPDDYFETLAGRTAGKIRLDQTRQRKRFLYPAVAAVLIALVSLSVFLIHFNTVDEKMPLADNHQFIQPHVDSSKVSASENPTAANDTIANYNVEDVDFELLFNEVPLEAIMQYLNEMDEFEF